MQVEPRYYFWKQRFNSTTNRWDGVIYNNACPEQILRAQFSEATEAQLSKQVEDWKQSEFRRLYEEKEAADIAFETNVADDEHIYACMDKIGQLHTLDSKKPKLY